MISLAELADVMSDRGVPVSLETLRWRCREGLIEGAKNVGGRWYLDAESADRFVREYIKNAPRSGSGPTSLPVRDPDPPTT